jgi:hypothetical protein
MRKMGLGGMMGGGMGGLGGGSFPKLPVPR